MEPTQEQVDAFKRGWSWADEQGLEGSRVLHGLVEAFRAGRDLTDLELARISYIEVLLGQGVPHHESVEQLKALEEALRVHARRTQSYGTVWRKWGPLSPLLSAAKKLDRLMQVFWFDKSEHRIPGKPKLDDAYDAINYLAFFIRLHREENGD